MHWPTAFGLAGLLHAVALAAALLHVPVRRDPRPVSAPLPFTVVAPLHDVARAPLVPVAPLAAGASPTPVPRTGSRTRRAAATACAPSRMLHPVVAAAPTEPGPLVPAPPALLALSAAAPGVATAVTSGGRTAGAGSGGARGTGDHAGGAGTSADGTGEGAGTGGGGGDVRRLIAERIRAHRRYPTLARRRGVEGTVLLSLSIARDGQVEVRVAQGADPVLDEAAREAALAAAPLPYVDGPVEVPLTFRLLEE